YTPVSPGTRDARLRAFLEDTFPEAFEYGRSRSPELFGERGQPTQQAQPDVHQPMDYGGMTTDTPFAQLIEEHEDAPAYLDALVTYIREEKGGEDMLEFVRTAVEIYEEGALEAFDAALERTS